MWILSYFITSYCLIIDEFKKTYFISYVKANILSVNIFIWLLKRSWACSGGRD